MMPDQRTSSTLSSVVSSTGEGTRVAAFGRGAFFFGFYFSYFFSFRRSLPAGQGIL